MKKIETAIKQAKRRLMAETKSDGLYENFGETEIRKLKDEFVDLTDYSEDMNKIRREIAVFEKWCLTFNDRKEG